LESEQDMMTAGVKQCRKNLKFGKVRTLYLAKDADPFLLEPLRALADEQEIQVDEAHTMKELGKKAGIAVGTAALAILK